MLAYFEQAEFGYKLVKTEIDVADEVDRSIKSLAMTSHAKTSAWRKHCTRLPAKESVAKTGFDRRSSL